MLVVCLFVCLLLDLTVQVEVRLIQVEISPIQRNRINLNYLTGGIKFKIAFHKNYFM